LARRSRKRPDCGNGRRVQPTSPGRSVRAELTINAAQAAVSTLKIRQQTGHVSDAMLGRYIGDGEMFMGNAAVALL
jgi:hypothetical protein